MLFDISKLSEDVLLANFARARYKFIWFRDEIKTYPEVLYMVVEQTLEYFQQAEELTEEKVGPTDIGYFGTKKSEEMKSLFFLYIRNRHTNLSSLYKQFREEYNLLTTGNMRVLDMKIETLLEIPTDEATKRGMNHETIKQNVQIMQNYKRPITRFETLANKSLNRYRFVSVKKRYNVLERDKFTCQLCGRSVPEVTLEADHKISVLDGGTSEMENLWTLCRECNRGKGPTTLWDEVIMRLKKST